MNLIYKPKDILINQNGANKSIEGKLRNKLYLINSTIKKLTIVICIVFTTLFVEGQKLIPAPNLILPSQGYFSVPKSVKINAVNTNTFNTDILIQYLRAENISVQQTNIKNKRSYAILLEKAKDYNHLEKILQNNKLNKDFKIGKEGYVLNISNTKIQLFALTDAGIFYGIQTLKQLITIHKENKQIPSMVIYDHPDIAIRAWQDDISRGPIPTMDLLKEQIRILSSFKLNYFTLYTEHVFKLKSHPSIAPEDGISKTQLEELANFAKKHYVTLIGNYQSFGHMEKTLSHPNYKHLAENGHILSPALDESYEFLNDVYEEIVPLYDGEYFNINCDETFGLGEGKSKSMVDSIGVSGVYVHHINKIDGLLKKYNKKILMWGDIATSYPEIVPNLPKDITVISWGYHAAESFDYAITPISNQNLDFWVAPGINCWSNIYPNLQETEINIYNFVRDGYKLNTLGVLNTSWDDDGLNFFNNNWHGFIWGAEVSWNAPSNLIKPSSENERKKCYENFNKAFDIHFYGLNKTDESISSLMIKFSSLHKSNVRDVLKNTRFLEPIFPIHFDYIQKVKKQENINLLNQLDSISHNLSVLIPKISKNKDNLDYFLFAINQTQFTVKKNLFRIALYKYLNGDKSLSKRELKANKLALISDLKILKDQYIDLWNRENRNHWLSENEKKYDELISSLTLLDGFIIIEPLNEIDIQGRKIMIRSVFNDFPIHYTINKNTVTSSSPLYSSPFYINQNTKISARSFNGDIQFPLQEINLLHHKGIGKLHKLTSKYSEYHPSYDGGGKYALLDGVVGDKQNIRSGKWQGFSGQDIEIELIFPKDETLNYFSMGFFQNTKSWVIFPKKVEIYIKNQSNDDYELYKVIEGIIPPEEKGNLKQNYTTALDNINPSHIKIIARYYGKLPEWHHSGSSFESMIFSDEIIIE